MRVDWQAHGDYAEMGGREAIDETLREIVAQVPQEHLRRLDAITVQDRDPRGIALGVYQQNGAGTASIFLYLEPHETQAQRVPPTAQPRLFRLELAHTLFHEVGHHVTRCLNRRAVPSRKSPQVNDAIEKWAEQYAAKRLAHFLGTKSDVPAS